MTSRSPLTPAGRLARAVTLVFLVLAVVVHGAAGWMFSTRIVEEGFTPAAGTEFGDPGAAALDIEVVSYPSPLGPIEAWHVPGTRSQWVVHVHGKGASLEEALPAAVGIAAAGYHQLIIGYRNDPGQPSDPSGHYRYGVTEWEDLAAAVDWAVARGASQVALFGYSTGGAIALSYHYKRPDAPVRALVLDSPNLDMGATIDLAARHERLVAGVPVPFTVTEVAKTLSGLRASINWTALDYLRRVDGLSVPVLVFHGTEDVVVPIETSRRLKQLRPAMVELVEVDGAGHVAARDANPTVYDQQVQAFLADNWR
jgi:uncharacterized protein